MVNPEHDGRLQSAERAIEGVMWKVATTHHLTALEWVAVFTQCLLGVVIEELDGHLLMECEDEDDDAFSDPSRPW